MKKMKNFAANKMEITKKVLLVAALVAVLAAGTAHAGGRRGRGWGGWDGGCAAWKGAHDGQWRGAHDGRRYGPRGGGIDVPQEIREKWAEIQKIEIDLRMELAREPINRERALELHAKRGALMQEFSDWRFKQRLDALSRPAEPQEKAD